MFDKVNIKLGTRKKKLLVPAGHLTTIVHDNYCANHKFRSNNINRHEASLDKVYFVKV